MPNYIGTGLPDVAEAHYIDWVPIQKVVCGGESSVTFSGMNSDFDEYKFEMRSIHPGTDNVYLSWQANAVGGDGFNETITSTAYRAYMQEDDSGGSVDYRTGEDQAQGTSFEYVVDNTGGDADQCMTADLVIYAPSNTTFVTHFQLEGTSQMSSDGEKHDMRAGYIHTSSAIDQIQFKFSSGNIDSGTITMFGLSK